MSFLAKMSLILLFPVLSSAYAGSLAEVCRRKSPELEIISKYGLQGVWQRLTDVWQKSAVEEFEGRDRVERALLQARDFYYQDIAALQKLDQRVVKLSPEQRKKFDRLLEDFDKALAEIHWTVELENRKGSWEKQFGVLQQAKKLAKRELVNTYAVKFEQVFMPTKAEALELEILLKVMLSVLPNGPSLKSPIEFMEVHDYVMDLVEKTKAFPSAVMELPHGFLWRASDINEIENAGLNINIVIRYTDSTPGDDVNMSLIFSPFPDLPDRLSMKICDPGEGTCEPMPLQAFCDLQNPGSGRGKLNFRASTPMQHDK